MPRPKKSETWYSQAIDLMLRDRLDLMRAAQLLGVELLPEEAATHQRRRAFRELYDQAARDYFESKSSVTQHTKQALVGRMLDAVDRLLILDKFADASEILFKIAKVEGWVGAETSINLFQELSGKDISEMREALKRKQSKPPDADKA